MAVEFTKEVTGTQLVTGLIGTIDIGSTISRVVDYQRDKSQSDQFVQLLGKVIDNILPNYYTILLRWATQDFEKTRSEATPYLSTQLKNQVAAIQEQSLQAALGNSVSATILGLKNKLDQTFNLTSDAVDTLYSQLRAALMEKATRYWLKELAYKYPSQKDFLYLVKSSVKSLDDLTNYIRETEGLDKATAAILATKRTYEVGYPSPKDLFIMWCKGLIDKSVLTDVLKFAYSFDPKIRDKYIQHLFYDPSPSELLRLSDLVPLDSSWVDSKLSAVGLNDTDKAVYKSAIEKRAIRDEISNIWGQYLDAYQWGLFTEKELESKLTEWHFSTAEIKIRLDSANLLRNKLRIKILRDAEIYKYRNGLIDEDTLYSNLQNLGIGKDIANALVKLEAAKKGVIWEGE
jgi:hypothetical protein